MFSEQLYSSYSDQEDNEEDKDEDFDSHRERVRQEYQEKAHRIVRREKR